MITNQQLIGSYWWGQQDKKAIDERMEQELRVMNKRGTRRRRRKEVDWWRNKWREVEGIRDERVLDDKRRSNCKGISGMLRRCGTFLVDYFCNKKQ